MLYPKADEPEKCAFATGGKLKYLKAGMALFPSDRWPLLLS